MCIRITLAAALAFDGGSFLLPLPPNGASGFWSGIYTGGTSLTAGGIMLLRAFKLENSRKHFFRAHARMPVPHFGGGVAISNDETRIFLERKR